MFGKPAFFITLFVLVFASLACSLPFFDGEAATPESGSADSPDVTFSSSAESSSASEVIAEVGACPGSLFPVVTGATWQYALSGSITDTFTRSITSTSSGGFSDQDVFGGGVSRTGEWTCQNGELLALTPTGGYSATVSAMDDGLEATFATVSNEGITLPARLDVGTTWSQTIVYTGTQDMNGTIITSENTLVIDCTVTAIEEVTVPAGVFTAARAECGNLINITFEGAPAFTFDVPATNWFAPGVGLVKSVTSGEGYSDVIELVTYMIP